MESGSENEDLNQSFYNVRFALLRWQNEKTNEAAVVLVEAARRFLDEARSQASSTGGEQTSISPGK